MNVTQPIENPNIPSELKKQVTAVRNQISLNEGEVKRLADLVTGLKYEVNQLVRQKVDIEDQIKNITDSKNKISAEVEFLADEKSVLLKEKAEIDSVISKSVSAFNKREEAVKIQEKDIKIATEKLMDDEAEISRREVILENEQKKFDAKVEKLKNALS